MRRCLKSTARTSRLWAGRSLATPRYARMKAILCVRLMQQLGADQANWARSLTSQRRRNQRRRSNALQVDEADFPLPRRRVLDKEMAAIQVAVVVARGVQSAHDPGNVADEAF